MSALRTLLKFFVIDEIMKNIIVYYDTCKHYTDLIEVTPWLTWLATYLQHPGSNHVQMVSEGCFIFHFTSLSVEVSWLRHGSIPILELII